MALKVYKFVHNRRLNQKTSDHLINDAEFAHAKRKKQRERTVAAFAKSPYDFNLYIARTAKPLIGEGWDIIIPGVEPAPGRLNCLFITNVTGGTRVPLTPWILAHRLYHAIQFSGGCVFADSIYTNCLDLLEPISRAVGVHERHIHHVLLTSRCAREDNLNSNDLDHPAELAAQLMLTGRIRLARAAEIKTRGRVGELRPPNLGDGLDELIAEVEPKIQGLVKTSIDSLLGKKLAI